MRKARLNGNVLEIYDTKFDNSSMICTQKGDGTTVCEITGVMEITEQIDISEVLEQLKKEVSK